MFTYALGKPDEDSDCVTLSDADVEVVDKSLDEMSVATAVHAVAEAQGWGCYMTTLAFTLYLKPLVAIGLCCLSPTTGNNAGNHSSHAAIVHNMPYTHAGDALG